MSKPDNLRVNSARDAVQYFLQEDIDFDKLRHETFAERSPQPLPADASIDRLRSHVAYLSLAFIFDYTARIYAPIISLTNIRRSVAEKETDSALQEYLAAIPRVNVVVDENKAQKDACGIVYTRYILKMANSSSLNDSAASETPSLAITRAHVPFPEHQKIAYSLLAGYDYEIAGDE